MRRIATGDGNERKSQGGRPHVDPPRQRSCLGGGASPRESWKLDSSLFGALMLAAAIYATPNVGLSKTAGQMRNAPDAPVSDNGRFVDGKIQEGVAGFIIGHDGSPLPNALVQASAIGRDSGPIPDIAVVTGPDGRFEWRLRPGHYRLDAILDGRIAGTADVKVSRAAVTEVRIRVNR